ncbi:PREDICTED: uncharacterized protein LOC101308030 [Fragaria vesca subsp. vesca]|uniref:uncharacterized protein LOC101308030 n=1 Tax=Fragaria vesca subsp. vesca TaxID=101020 RepID=UPI0002C334CC|nr:PREDICTED: uncharacterized protein LOC101308030 [Fragaria vesca subsp. vesca]
MKAFVRQDIDIIPSHFILPRWRQGANKFRVTDSEALVKNDDKEQSEALRFSHMCRRATQLACHAAPSDEAYKMYMDGLDELSNKISEVNKVTKEVAIESEDHVFQDEVDQCASKSSESLLLDPNISKTKGRKKDDNSTRNTNSSKRIKSGMELAQSKKRKCTMYQQTGHNKLTCILNPDAKRNMNASTNQRNKNMQESDEETSEEKDSDSSHQE